MGLEHVRSEIEHMRVQVSRQRGEIRQLERAGISTAAGHALLERMLNKIDELCLERDKLKARRPARRNVLGGRSW
jgi:hypothetical protein